MLCQDTRTFIIYLNNYDFTKVFSMDKYNLVFFTYFLWRPHSNTARQAKAHTAAKRGLASKCKRLANDWKCVYDSICRFFRTMQLFVFDNSRTDI